MIKSMTGFATLNGTHGDFEWSWELKSVNNKGLDIRLRVPDWITGLENDIRSILKSKISRGSLQLNLRLSKVACGDEHHLDDQKLQMYLSLIKLVEAEAQTHQVGLAPMTAGEIISKCGSADQNLNEEDVLKLKSSLLLQLEPLIEALIEMRNREGINLQNIMSAHLQMISDLTKNAEEISKQRISDHESELKKAIAKQISQEIDPDRLAQEIALIIVKSDVTEEIDRLKSHIVAASDLLKHDGPVGRRLDFMMQEFNREVNTLCSKSNHKTLTAIGLDMKVAIDQMREQVQNVE